MSSSFALRSVAVSVFIVCSTLNYLDRTILNVLARPIMSQMHFNQTGFGVLISTLSIAYALSSISGWVLDRFGVNRGICAAVAWWSLSAISTGLVRGFGGLAACRAALGIGESAGLPAVGKLNGIYLKPGERALGAAVNQIGLSLGAAIAPLWIGVAIVYGWCLPLMLTGLLGSSGFHCGCWSTAPFRRAMPPPSLRPNNKASPASPSFANAISSCLFWPTSYGWEAIHFGQTGPRSTLCRSNHLTLKESASYLWIPPLISNLGGFFGGWLSPRWSRKAANPSPHDVAWYGSVPCVR